MANEYGVTAAGFVRKRLDVIKKEYEEDIAAQLGCEIATDEKSVFGILIGIFADRDAEQWEVAEQVYYSQYPTSAEGISLDNAIQYAGVRRKPDRKTVIKATCWGADGTHIHTGSAIRKSSSPVQTYTAEKGGQITSGSARYVKINVVAAAPGAAYSITLDGTTYNYTAQAGDTAASIASQLASEITDAQWTATANGSKIEIDRVDKSGGHTINLSTNLDLLEVASNIDFTCSEYGPVNPPVGTVNEIVSQTADWTKVSNDLPAIVGQYAESDTMVRQSYSSRVNAQGRAMIEAIAAYLVENVANCKTAVVYENDTDAEDSEGRPPHSVEVVVDGGDDYDVAYGIWQTKAGGIVSYGSNQVEIVDSFGETHIIRFNRPISRQVWLKVSLRKNPEEAFAADTPKRVQEIILEESSKYASGQDIILQRFYGPIYKGTQGIGEINITAAVSDTPPAPEEYSGGMIPISIRERAVFDAGRIEVTVID